MLFHWAIMRSYICVRYENRLYKIVWMNEDKQGIYVGWYGKVTESHFSYHKDGYTHLKVFQHSKKPLSPYQKTPIDDVRGFVQIGYQGIPLHSQMMRIIGQEYTKQDQRSGQVFFIDSNLFIEETMDLDLYIVEKDKEQDFVQFTFQHHNEKIQFCFLNFLDNFPNHKLAMLILKP